MFLLGTEPDHTVVAYYCKSNNLKSIFRISDILDSEDYILGDYLGPTEEYENLRWRIYFNTKELWHYLLHQLGRVSTESLQPDKIKTILEEVADRKGRCSRTSRSCLDGYEAWRRHEAASVSDLVQRRLHYLQHPSDCRAARKLVCDRHMLEEAIKKYPQYTFYGDYTRPREAKTTRRFCRASLSGLLVDLHMLIVCDYVVLTLSSVLEEAIKKYNQYTFYGDYTSAQRANTSSRYCRSSLSELLVDLHMLTLCDYVVLTLSSNIGDLIDARNNYWNGTGNGTCIKSNVSGLFPWYKTAEYLVPLPRVQTSACLHPSDKHRNGLKIWALPYHKIADPAGPVRLTLRRQPTPTVAVALGLAMQPYGASW